MIRIIHCVPSLHPSDGGPSRTVVALADSLARHDECRVALASQGRRGGALVLSKEDSVVRYIGLGNDRMTLALGLPIEKSMRQARMELVPNLIHSHGVWHAGAHWAARLATRLSVPLIIHPRGMLEPWALEQKRLKKRLALGLYQQKELNSASALVATSEMEFENLRRFGLRQPMAVIPNGVELPALGPGGPVRVRSESHLRTALFLSRIHPKKGVLELVEAWASVRPEGWRLRIAGPDEGGHWHEVGRLLAKLGLADIVEYLGPVEGEAKAAAYRDADLFVLPSFSENFGVVVAEALAYGLPVITTRATPWAGLETHACGWWIDTGAEPLKQALRESMSREDSELRAMGERGRAYVQRFDWDAIATQTLALYRWLLGQGERPECVHI